tara:strand:- start:1925 stop:2920 length:996 start_codon:yes stop_codon:yes gene_type:complete
MQKIKNLVNKYRNTDLRLKLKYLNKITNINFYPKYFSNKGLNSFWSKIIFYLIHKEYSRKDFKFKYNLFKNLESDLEKSNLILTFPRSGTTYLKMLINSYFELFYKLGNGKGKYISALDEFTFNIDKQLELNLFSLITENYDSALIYSDYKNYTSRLKRSNYIFSHYPISDIDLFKINKNKKILFLLRNPEDAILSYVKFLSNFNSYLGEDRKSLNSIKHKKLINDYKKFFNFFINYENKCLVKFEDLTKNPYETIKKIFNYFGNEFDINLMKEAIEKCDKKTLISDLSATLEFTNRFSSESQAYLNEDINLKDNINKMLDFEIKKYKEIK